MNSAATVIVADAKDRLEQQILKALTEFAFEAGSGFKVDHIDVGWAETTEIQSRARSFLPTEVNVNIKFEGF